MKDRSKLDLAREYLARLPLRLPRHRKLTDDGAHGRRGATNQQQFSNQSRRNELVKIVRLG